MEKKIGLDTRMLHHTGIGTYLKALLAEWKISGVPADMKFTACGRGEDLPSGFSHADFDAPIYSLQEQFACGPLMAGKDLWHSPHYNVPLQRGKTRLVVTIHDVIHWVFRKKYLNPLQAAYAGFMLKKAARGSDHVIAVSQHTKNDLVEHFGADASRISVIHQGVSEYFFETSPDALKKSVREKFALPENFFLYVGLLKPHKNAPLLIRAFQKARQAGEIHAALVMVGKSDASFESLYPELVRTGKMDGIFFLSNVSKEELRALYQTALALTHPSLYEGFGLTLLEAMAGGTPVIACSTSSIPEVAGRAAYLVEPDTLDPLYDALIQMEVSGTLRRELAEKGRQQAAKFTWKETARKTLEVYKKVLA